MPRLLDWGFKDPDDKGDYTVDWEEWLAGDTISTSTFSYTTGGSDSTPLVLSSPSNSTTDATIVIDDGTEGQTYYITNRILTAAGWNWDKTTILRIARK